MNEFDFIQEMLVKQATGLPIFGDEHQHLIRLIDRGLLGMAGFRYCSPEEAHQDFRRIGSYQTLGETEAKYVRKEN